MNLLIEAEKIRSLIQSSKNDGFYGLQFFLLGEKYLGRDTNIPLSNSIEANNTSHKEFLNYTLIKDNLDFKTGNEVLEESNNITLNWSLLRSFKNNGRLNNFVEKKINSPFLDDQKDEYSLQYAYFSLFVMCEIHKYFKTISFDILQKHFLALESIVKDVDYDLFIGRGQYQLFGYASLIYCAKYIMNDRILIDKIIKKIAHTKYNLVVSSPFVNNYTPEQNQLPFAGWYAYNRYFDYLCFYYFIISYLIKDDKKKTI
ncbi:MAG: hypothetical protein ACMZ7B_09580 [Balneola sp.]